MMSYGNHHKSIVVIFYNSILQTCVILFSCSSISLDDTNLVGNIKSIVILAESYVSLLQSLGGDEGVYSVGFNSIKFLDGIFDLTLVALNINNENKGVRVLDQLHGRFGGQRILDDRVLVQDVLLGGRLCSILGCLGKVNGLSTVEVYLVVDAGSLLGDSLGELLSYC